MSSKKIILLSLLLIVSLCVIAGISFFRKSQDKSINQKNISKAGIETPVLEVYVKEVLREEFYKTANLQIRQKTVYPDDTSRFKSNVWSINNDDIYYQGFFSIKGDTYEESDKPLSYEILVKKSIQKGLTDEQKVQMLQDIFLNNYLNDNFVKKFTIPEQVQDVDVFDYNEDGTANLSTAKKYTIQDNSRVTEYVWENPDKTLESRAIWIIDEEETRETVYFTACRIFPDSKLYSQRTCFQTQ